MKFLLLAFATVLTCLICIDETKHSLAADNNQHSDIQQTLHGRSHRLTFLDQVKIPNFEIDGLPARIHTQGIYVTETSLYITGRLEHDPKRALFLRLSRADLSNFEFLDIPSTLSKKQEINAEQDHPGGFDYDGSSFWIPVAISKPHSPTTIVRIQTPLDSPLAEATTEVAFVVDDHIGALAVDQQSQRIYGANWDTKEIFVWNTDGNELRRIPREKLIQDHPNWALAVQDWKSLPGNIILAGGHDKNPHRDKSKSRALLDWIDTKHHKLLDRIHIVAPNGDDSSLTHEGMTLFNNELFLLPGDLGDDAILYRYRVETSN